MVVQERFDGRADDMLRPVSIEIQPLLHAEGSALITIGNTKVLCAATIEEKIPAWLRGKGSGWVHAEYAMLPRATHDRTARDGVKGKIGGRSHEIQRLIGRSLRAVVDLELLGERSVIVDCDVIQADGGTRTAAITGAWVALSLALRTIVQPDAARWPLRRGLAAVSVGIIDGVPRLDLPYEEDSRAEVDMNVVMTDDGRFIEVQSTAERSAFDMPSLLRLLELAQGGITRLIAVQHAALAGAISL